MNEQEKRELLIKAAVKFGGEWPEGCTCLQVGRDGNIRGFRKCLSEHYESEQKAYILCTQAGFEVFMQDLANKAPEGATHCLPTASSNYYWMKDVGGFLPVAKNDWQYVSSSAYPLDEIYLIPLPKREPAPWVPEVGQECEYSYDFFFLDRCNSSCKVVAYYLDEAWIELSVDKTRHVVKIDKIKFRPIRTEADIERQQALYDSLCELDADLDDYQINRLIEFIQGRDDD